MMIQVLISILVFAGVFMTILFAFPPKKDEAMREQLASLESPAKKKSAFVQFLGILAPVNKFVLAQPALRRKLADRLEIAGSAMNVDEYLVLNELLAILAPIAALVILGPKTALHWLVLAAAAGLALPELWMRKRIDQRQRAITKALPEVIDLLNLSVGAGMDFMMALAKVLERARPNPLTEELTAVYQETKLGKTKAEALKSMAKRVNLPDVSSFVRILVQAEKMGTSISDVLGTQSEQARIWRFQRAERQALKAPLKLLVPLVFCILPVVLIIVGAPIFLRYLSSGSF